MHDNKSTPYRLCGVELIFSGDKKIFVGKHDTSHVSFINLASKTPTSIEIEAKSSNSNGNYRHIRAYDNSGSIEGCSIDNPLYVDTDTRRVPIPAGHDLIGVSCTTDSEGFITWCNFLSFPAGQAIL
jgi:hypothetical protein